MASANSNQNVNDKLVIFKGDDTGGVFGRSLQFAIEVAEGADLTGCRAEWIFDGIVKEIDAPLTAGETREIFYSHNETERMCIGVRYGTFRIIDAEGKRATMTNTRAVEVTDNVARCYPGASAATVRIGTFISWENISGKPILVKTVNGEAPDASGNINIEIEEPVLDDTVTEESPNGVKSSGIWSWVKSLLPHWLTSDYAEPATVASVANKLDKSGGQMTGTLSGGNGFGWIMNRQGESLQDILGTFPTYEDLSAKADIATTLSGYGITDGATKESIAPEYSATSAYSVGAIVYHDGNIYQCKTAIADGGESWNPAHWELRKLDDFFTESNSLLNGRLAYSRNTTGLKDRAFNALTFDGTEYNLSTALAAVTPTVENQPRDLLIVATATASTTISFTAGTIKGDKPTIDGAGTWLITLTEYAANTWYCRQIKMEDAA